MDLHDERAAELERGREQRRGGHHFAQQGAHRGRVVVAFEHCTPGRFQMHDLAAHGRVLEQETLDSVGHGGLRIRDSENDYLNPQSYFFAR